MLRKTFVALATLATLLIGVPAIAQSVVGPFRYQAQATISMPALDPAILSETGLAHYWNFGDSPGGATPGPCPTALADLVMSDTNTFVTPSPVPMAPITSGAMPVCGASSPVFDGTTAAELTNGPNAQGQYFAPSTTGLMSSLCNGNAGGACNQDFSVMCIVVPNVIATGNFFFSADGTTSGLSIGMSAADGLILQVGSGAALMGFYAPATGVPQAVMYTFAHTGTLSSFYVNGVLVKQLTSPVPMASPNSNSLFGSQTTTSGGWNGRILKCGLFNDAETPQQVRAQFALTGLY